MDSLIIFGARYLFLIPVAIWIVFFFKQNREVRKKLVWFSAFALPLTYALGLLARGLWFNTRPFVEKGIEPLIAHVADNGFPSDHILLLASLALIMMYFDRKLSIVLWIIVVLVGSSRILAQVHHFVDIFGSIVIALIAGWLVHFVLERRKRV